MLTLPRFTNRIKTNEDVLSLTQNTATIRRASVFKNKLYTPELEAREKFETDYKIRKFEMIKQEKKKRSSNKNKILWKEKVDSKKHRIKLLQMKNVIEIKNSKVRIHINKTKLK